MNHLLNFSMGALSTFTLSASLTPNGIRDLLLSQIVSVVGGVVSAVIIARMQKRWNNDEHRLM